MVVIRITGEPSKQTTTEADRGVCYIATYRLKLHCVTTIDPSLTQQIAGQVCGLIAQAQDADLSYSGV
jgi:hypothetical protein